MEIAEQAAGALPDSEYCLPDSGFKSFPLPRA
jgi:hypothetical protein